MSAPIAIKIIAENLTDQALALASGDGRRQPVEIDLVGLRSWLDNFAALPALDLEDADARLHLVLPARRLVVRRAGGRLGSEEADTFVAGTVDEIVALVVATPPPTGITANGVSLDVSPDVGLDAVQSERSRTPAQAWLLGGLLMGFALICWWTLPPEKPDGVEWIGNAVERQAVLTRAAGSYIGDDERLALDAGAARLTATNNAGEETLRTTVRVGRRGGIAVLVAENGVILEIMNNGQLRLDGTSYRRVPSGG